MPRLLVLIHADASVVPLYRARLDDDVDVLTIVGPALAGVAGGGMSSRYDALALACLANSPRSALDGLLVRYKPPLPLRDYAEIWLATWSAGYAFVRHLTAADRARLAGVVLLDSGHTSLDADGTASDKGVAWAVEMAKAARGGGPTFWIGHSDVKTYGTVASTTLFSAEVERLAGATDGGFLTAAVDVAKSDLEEHVAALTGWGPHFVAAAMTTGAGPLPDREATTPRSAPPSGLELGQRALELGLRFLGTREVAGPKADATIAGWLARCERGGRLLGLSSDETAWCAAFASACAYDAATGDEKPPHGFRASVAELWRDAVLAGAAREANFAPDVGDLAIFARAGGDPRIGGTGHVARVVEPPSLGAGGAWHFRTLDGNHANAVALVDRVVDVMLVGWVQYPRALATTSPEAAARLVALVRAVEAGDVGREALEKIIDNGPPSAA